MVRLFVFAICLSLQVYGGSIIIDFASLSSFRSKSGSAAYLSEHLKGKTFYQNANDFKDYFESYDLNQHLDLVSVSYRFVENRDMIFEITGVRFNDQYFDQINAFGSVGTFTPFVVGDLRLGFSFGIFWQVGYVLDPVRMKFTSSSVARIFHYPEDGSIVALSSLFFEFQRLTIRYALFPDLSQVATFGLKVASW